MKEKPFDISELIAMHLAGILLDKEELTCLNIWRRRSKRNEALFLKLCAPQQISKKLWYMSLFDTDRGWEKFNRRRKHDERIAYIKKIMRYAAVFAALLIGGYSIFWFIESKYNGTQHERGLPGEKTQFIHPGKSDALLTMDSGEQFALQANASIQIKGPSDITICTDSNSVSFLSVNKEKQPTFSIIETPAGGEYILLLSDGSKVFMNAETRLRFPDIFNDSIRKVELLTGEIYLEVDKQQKPFMVVTPMMNIRVTGTVFNISLYDDIYKTTLVEGKVELYTYTGSVYPLSPSQQAKYDPVHGKIEIKTVDTALYTAWKNGMFVFRDCTLKEIMNSLSRWYNFSVEYADPAVEKIRFGCSLNRYKDITPFLDLLEDMGGIDITVTGNKLRVSSK